MQRSKWPHIVELEVAAGLSCSVGNCEIAALVQLDATLVTDTDSQVSTDPQAGC